MSMMINLPTRASLPVMRAHEFAESIEQNFAFLKKEEELVKIY